MITAGTELHFGVDFLHQLLFRVAEHTVALDQAGRQLGIIKYIEGPDSGYSVFLAGGIDAFLTEREVSPLGLVCSSS